MISGSYRGTPHNDLVVATFAMLIIGGCAAPTKRDPASARFDGAGSQLLRVDSGSVMLGSTTTGAMSPDVLLARVRKHLASQNELGAANIVETYPDVAEALLLADSIHDRPETRFVARCRDRLAAPIAGGWHALLDHRLGHPDHYHPYVAQRAAWWRAYRAGEFETALGLPLEPPASAPAPWFAVEAYTLRATAALTSGHPDQAERLFRSAADSATAFDNTIRGRNQFFAALACKVGGRLSAALQLRGEAMQSVSPGQCTDPLVVRLLLEITPSRAHDDRWPHRRLLFRLGELEYARGAPQAALLSWKRAEAKLGPEPADARLRLAQADALLALQQIEPATALLLSLDRTPLRPEALAKLGMLYLRQGRVETGLSFMEQAVADTSPASHAHIHADYALAMLAAGDEETALEHLHAARSAFDRHGDRAGVATTLENELRFLLARNDRARALKLQRMLARVHRLETP